MIKSMIPDHNSPNANCSIISETKNSIPDTSNDSIQKPLNKSWEMPAVVQGFDDEFIPAITTRGQFGTIINFDEDRRHKIFILMAPNYPEQRPASQRAPMPFK